MKDEWGGSEGSTFEGCSLMKKPSRLKESPWDVSGVIIYKGIRLDENLGRHDYKCGQS